jgi:hypothetical protein
MHKDAIQPSPYFPLPNEEGFTPFVLREKGPGDEV